MVARNENSGAVVNIGDTVTNFRGESGTLARLARPRDDRRTGKVVVHVEGERFDRETYDTVWGLAVTDDTP
jgi:hypothetical protein